MSNSYYDSYSGYSDYEGSYSYSYSDDSRKKSEGYSYSYSGEYSGEGSYSDSYYDDYSRTGNSKSDDYYSYSTSKAGTDSYGNSNANGKSDEYSYSYTPTYTNTKTDDKNKTVTGDSNYYYSGETGSTMTYSGNYEYSDSQYYDDYSYSYDDYSYSDSNGGRKSDYSKYYYSDDYYSYSDDYTKDSYYYSDNYSGYSDYYSNSDSYKYSDYSKYSGEYSDYSGYYSSSYPTYSGDKSRGSSYYYDSYRTSGSGVESVSKSLSSTTSSYSTPESQRSQEGDQKHQLQIALNRELITLRTPSKEFPRIPPPPKRCFLKLYSGEDMVHRFVYQLYVFQKEYELKKLQEATPGFQKPLPIDKEENPDVEKSNKKEKKPKKKKQAGSTKYVPEKEPMVVSLTPEGFYSQRSLRIALNCVGLTHIERKRVLQNVPVPTPQVTLTQIINMCYAAHVKELVAKKFLSLDVARTGELELQVVAETLRALGIVSSPVLGDLRINVDSAHFNGEHVMCMTIEKRIASPMPPGIDAEGNNDDIQNVNTKEGTQGDETVWEVTKIPVLAIVKRAVDTKMTTSVTYHDGCVYMGSEPLCRCSLDENTFQRMKTYIEAATYLCVLTKVFTVFDDVSRSFKVLYPHLVRSLLLSAFTKKTGEAENEQRKLIYMENLFRSIYKPMETLDSYATSKGIFMYAGKAATESTLHVTQDTEEKRRRNVVPNTTTDLIHFEKNKEIKPEVVITFEIEKVRLPKPVPPEAVCFCYVSAITPDNVFLPAIRVEVKGIKNSKKGGYTWVFNEKKEKQTLLFSGPCDRLYIECCFENVGDSESEKEIVWCAGYSVVPVNEVKSNTLKATQGSLLDRESEEVEDTSAKKPSFFAKLFKKKKKNALISATNIKVRSVKVKEAQLPTPDSMPKRYLIKLRHVVLISQLRSAIIDIGKECAYAGQALRHQSVKRVFAVVSNDYLLDQLLIYLKEKEKKYPKGKEEREEAYKRDLCAGVTYMATLYNCFSKQDSAHFARCLLENITLENPFKESAPMQCVEV